MPHCIWIAYRRLNEVKSIHTVTELIDLISPIRSTCGLACELTMFEDTVCQNFQNWIMTYHSGGTRKLDCPQMNWLHVTCDHIASSLHIENNDLNLPLSDARGCLRKWHEISGTIVPSVINELNEALGA